MLNKIGTFAGIAAMSLIGLLVVGFIVARITGTISLHLIPSRSMEPNLKVGNHLVVSTIPYWNSAPKRGDIITFIVPASQNATFIQRIVGLPGDTVQMQNEKIILNGTPVPRKRVADYMKSIDRFGTLNSHKVAQYEEQMPSGQKYRVIEMIASKGLLDNTRLFKVPQNHYFVMGDNRDNAADSRVSSFVGYVPREHFRGKLIAKNPIFESIGTLISLFKF